MRRRRIYDGRYKSRKGDVIMRRLGKKLRYESTVEEDFLRVMDVSREVVDVTRAETVEYFSPDGKARTYTTDFTVRLASGRVLSIECKPRELLPELLLEEPAMWQVRGVRLDQLGRPLNVVTEADLPKIWLRHARLFGPFHDSSPHPGIREYIRQVLWERGGRPLSELLTLIRGVHDVDGALINATLYGMVARHELVADVAVKPPNCVIDLPGKLVDYVPPPLGVPLSVALDQAAKGELDPEPVATIDGISPGEGRFLDTERGQRSLHLFSLYSNPRVPLDAGLVEKLTTGVGISRRTLFRFRQTLLEAGAPNVTFSDLVPLLAEERTRPTRQVAVEVEVIMERLVQTQWLVRPDVLGRARHIADLHRAVKQACREAGLAPPAYNTVGDFVERVRLRDPVEAALRRDGVEASQKLEARQGKLEVNLYGQLIAIDCTKCDVFTTAEGIRVELVQNGRGKNQRKSGGVRGHVVTVVEGATSQVLWSEVFLGAITAERVLRVTRGVILRLRAHLEEAGVVMMPQARGLPSMVRLDAGKEFDNGPVRRALAFLGIELLPRKKWNRHNGGLEERTIQTLIHLHHMLPGTSMNNVANRGEYDGQKRAVFTIAELNALHQLNTERHNALPAPRQFRTRHEQAQHLLDTGLSVWRPLEGKQLEYVLHRMHPREMRVCRGEGIEMHGLIYTARALDPLIEREAEVEVFYNRDDISVAHAAHPDVKGMIRIEARLPEWLDAPLSLAEWKVRKKQIAEAHEAALNSVKLPQQLAAEIFERRQLREAEHRARPRPPREAVVKSPAKSKSGGTSRIKAAPASKVTRKEED
ncbi:hypothetical protein [Deinococcus budaensis]|uniref:Integrase catalytic domain-containing protein n=1 Tax=Deinococcus budaensis TaxID=1665626 RepID=A0A7W8GCH5_9DEIO|nr:hypothetical protein [Deinococcus budaensis]MBB5232963.1 hypothetical protein [Deinococcus budaensis]